MNLQNRGIFITFVIFNYYLVYLVPTLHVKINNIKYITYKHVNVKAII